MLFALFFFTSINLFAQPPCVTFPGNKIYCVGETVTLVDCFVYQPGGNAAIPSVSFEGGPSFPVLSHKFNTPGISEVKILGGSPQTPVLETVTILAPSPPSYIVQICEGRQVTVVIQNPTGELYEIDFGHGSLVVTSAAQVNYTYPDDSPRIIKVKGQCSSYGPEITVTPIQALIQPEITKVTNDQINKRVTVEFKAISFLKYKVNKSYNNGTPEFVREVSNTSGLTTVSFPTDGMLGKYCIEVLAFDDCGEVLPSQICTIEDPNANADNTFNTLSLTSDASYSYQVFDSDQLVGSLSPPNSTLVHSNSICGREYFYKIIGTQNLGGNPVEAIAILPPIKGLSTNTPSEVVNLNSTILGSTVQLQWDKPTAFTVSKYRILQSINNEPYTQIAETQRNFFTDSKASILKNRYCYKISYIDSCDNISLTSLPTCPIILKSENVSTNGIDTYKSEWTNYIGGVPNPTYTVEKLDFANNVIGTYSPTPPDTTFSDVDVDNTAAGVRYRVKVTIGTSSFYSNVFTIKFEPKIIAPNAFTPNGDNVNDTFTFYGKYIKSFNMFIYNRWGEMVYTTTNLGEGWDGTYQNKEALVDDYSFVIEALDNEGKLFVETGTVSLLR